MRILDICRSHFSHLTQCDTVDRGQDVKKDSTRENILHIFPLEVWFFIFQYCPNNTLVSFARVNCLALWSVNEFNNTNIVDFQNIFHLLPLHTDLKIIINNLSEKPLIKTHENKKEFEIKRKRNIHYLKEHLNSKFILDRLPPSIYDLFKTETKIHFNKDFLCKNHEKLKNIQANYYYDIAAEQLVRAIIFSKHLLKRGNAIKAVMLFIKPDGSINIDNVTIKDLQEIGFLPPGKIPNIVWCELRRKVENVTSSTKIHSVYASFIFINYVTLCSQHQIPDSEQFLMIPPNHVKYQFLRTGAGREVLTNILQSNYFCDNRLYDQISLQYFHPFHNIPFDESYFTLLSEHNFDLNCTNKYGISPLELALSRNNIERASLFIIHKATINWNTKYLDRLLRAAVQSGDYETVEKAINLGANVNIPISIGNIALEASLLTFANNLPASNEIIDLLNKKGAHISFFEVQWMEHWFLTIRNILINLRYFGAIIYYLTGAFLLSCIDAEAAILLNFIKLHYVLIFSPIVTATVSIIAFYIFTILFTISIQIYHKMHQRRLQNMQN